MGSDTPSGFDLERKKQQLADEAYDYIPDDEILWLFHKDPEIRRLARERSERIHRRTMMKLGIDPDATPKK